MGELQNTVSPMVEIHIYQRPDSTVLRFRPMRLYEAAIACRAYTAFGGEFDDSFRQFVSITGGALRLESDDCGSALMKWLNEWGCRQFAKEYHDDALERIRLWAQRYLRDLPGEAASILELTDSDIHRAAGAFDVLKELQASQKGTRRGVVSVRVGATGGAKIIYALRPQALPPWDDAIRNRLHCDGSADSYASFIRTVIHEVEELLADAAKHGVSRSQLPAIIGSSESTLAKIVDEYFWVTITRGFAVPKVSDLQTWARWCGVI